MPDASPTKWHLAHTTWFFETFVLRAAGGAYRPFDDRFATLFNSYYEAVGPRPDRARRGLQTRPSLADVHGYRQHVDDALCALMASESLEPELQARVELGLHHEQQHQELILTDIKHALGTMPLQPFYRVEPPRDRDKEPRAPARWRAIDAGLVSIGADDARFSFDNERPRHRTFVAPFALAERLVTAAEFAAFIIDGGYETPSLWLSDGWHLVQQEGWRAPLYWQVADDRREVTVYTLAGPRVFATALASHARGGNEPVCHVSFYEADAFARWAGARLPTEAEWEHAVAASSGAEFATRAAEDDFSAHAPFASSLHPAPQAEADSFADAFGGTWQWTGSAYLGYPGYRPAAGALGEYNGKFMINQMVLRGASALTARSHARLTYRNFFSPAARWQMTGLRLARDS